MRLDSQEFRNAAEFARIQKCGWIRKNSEMRLDSQEFRNAAEFLRIQLPVLRLNSCESSYLFCQAF